MTLPGDLLSLKDRVALVTGAAGDIGSRVARLFLDAGATVCATDLPGQELPDDVADRAELLACDATEHAEVESLAETIRDRHGRLDILVHCTGITRDAMLWKMDSEAWDEVLSVNLDSAFFFLHACVPLLRGSDKGAVVLTSSINGERGKFGQANYASSKAGLIALGKTAARELGAFGIRVNSLAPGFIESRMTASLPEEFQKKAIDETALGRAGQPEDVARAALFLCSDLSRHVTGQVLRVDGGQLIA